MPIGIAILGFLSLLAGVFSLFWGTALIGIGGAGWFGGLLVSDSIQAWGGHTFGAGMLSLFTGGLEIAAGLGLWARSAWARMLAIVGCIGAAVTPLVSLSHGNPLALVGLVLPGAVLLYLVFDQDVRAAFRHA